MTMTNQNFSMAQGDSVSPIITVVDSNGVPIPLQAVQDIIWIGKIHGSTLLTKKKSTGGIVFTTDGTNGEFTVLFSSTDTTTLALLGAFDWYAQVIDGGGNQSTVVDQSSWQVTAN